MAAVELDIDTARAAFEASTDFTVGLEEEVMLLEPDGSPAWRSEDVLQALPPRFAEQARGETHGLALELSTRPHATVAAAASELRFLRAGLAAATRSLGLRAAVAGTHPAVRSEDVEVSPGARYQYLHASLRELARREPTFALHVHVAIPEPEMAVRAYNRMRAHIPVLLALLTSELPDLTPADAVERLHDANAHQGIGLRRLDAHLAGEPSALVSGSPAIPIALFRLLVV